jgi:hypothetical protein
VSGREERVPHAVLVEERRTEVLCQRASQGRFAGARQSGHGDDQHEATTLV